MDVSDLDPEQAPGPLAGLLVADFSRVLAGPYATMLLGDLGATVIKVEGPGGDDTRTWQPPVRETDDGPVSTYYLSINRNKRSVVLDLADPADRELAATLARRADVLVENFKHGGLARFGLDYDTVRASNPSVIYCSITGFGTQGGAALPGYDLLIQAVSGLMSLTGSAEGSPYRAGVAVYDVFTGLHAGLAILAALHHRDRTGEGQHVETSLLATALSTLVNQASSVVAGGAVPYRMGNAHPSLFPYEPLPTADGELIIIAGNDNQYRRLCTAIGLPELGTDERFRTMADRTARREELRPLLLAALAQRSAAQWFDILTEAGVPCGPINTVADGIALAERLGLAPVVDGEVPTIRNPVDYSATPPSYRLPPPALGADSDTVRAWLKGN
ncbi:MAG TPA: CoA transferase [Pseudonocardiaceae bacterium]|jgi:crotonobetainyl-CoA:carnitine CoA-transferase CaiB-like acyl-CoA transferase|nr:CoA transferase [Pseudonocardiaceae bacterium]